MRTYNRDDSYYAVLCPAENVWVLVILMNIISIVNVLTSVYNFNCNTQLKEKIIMEAVVENRVICPVNCL
jgi:hypothetical protein